MVYDLHVCGVVWVMCYGYGYDDDYCLIDGVGRVYFIFFYYC